MLFKNTSLSNVTNGQGSDLATMSDEKVFLYIPVIVLLLFFMLLGTPGNVLVIYVYNHKFRRRSANLFITSMAIYDLIGCVFMMPAEIYDLRFQYATYGSVRCKLFRFIESFIIFGSTVILIEIAFDRYFKICNPLRILKLTTIRYLCFISIFSSILCATPTTVLFDISRVARTTNGETGFVCSIKDTFRGGIFHKTYCYCLIAIFSITSFVVMGFYTRVWTEIRKRKRLSISDRLFSSMTADCKHVTLPKNNEKYNNESTNNIVSTRIRRSVSFLKIAALMEMPKKIKVSRTFVIFVCVTTAFVISYLPGLVIMMYESIIKDSKQTASSPTEVVVLKIFSRFHFISNCINPWIYSFLNPKFRQECKRLIVALKKSNKSGRG